MGFFKALKDDLKEKAGLAKEKIQSSDTYQNMQESVEIAKAGSKTHRGIAGYAGKAMHNELKDAKSTSLAVAANLLGNSMPRVAQALRRSAVETKKSKHDLDEHIRRMDD